MIGNAFKIAKIATGKEEEETPRDDKNAAAKELGAKGGKKRAANLSPEMMVIRKMPNTSCVRR